MTVTKQQQLEWLAKEFSVWPGFTGVGIRMGNLVIGEHGGEHLITREEWQHERDKIQKRKEYEELSVMSNPKVAQAVIDAHNALKDLPFASVFMDAWTKGANEFMDSLQNRIDIDPIGGKPFSVAIEQIHPVDPKTLERNINAMTGLGAAQVTPRKPYNSWHERGELPPVGCECEIMHKCWIEPNKVKIAAITKEYVIVVDGQSEQHYHLRDITFRPLRTEREKAIDEMMYLVMDGLMSHEMAKELAIKMHDAGYRKVSQ